uniref:Uncharacterized protein n=1 Tax=Anopheles atroparvus TaxID=41427 RepID=A0A182J617_ANOAO
SKGFPFSLSDNRKHTHTLGCIEPHQERQRYVTFRADQGRYGFSGDLQDHRRHAAELQKPRQSPRPVRGNKCVGSKVPRLAVLAGGKMATANSYMCMCRSVHMFAMPTSSFSLWPTHF